jgi:hypothetical protein
MIDEHFRICSEILVQKEKKRDDEDQIQLSWWLKLEQWIT